MTQQRVVIDYLRDIAESASNALEFVVGMSFDDFHHDIKTQFAVVRALEIIGEAAKCIPDDPTCPNAGIPLDAVEGIQNQARQKILSGQVLNATQRLEQRNGWLQANGQFQSFGVDAPAFVAASDL